jgi:hypothetical protein
MEQACASVVMVLDRISPGSADLVDAMAEALAASARRTKNFFICTSSSWVVAGYATAFDRFLGRSEWLGWRM